MLTVLFLLMAAGAALFAQSSLLYLEMQDIYGYRSDTQKPILYSYMAKDAMQKPSVGFDWLKVFANAERNVALASVQFRMAYNASATTPFEPQLYNAWLKYKSSLGDVALGHLKPASGLSYTLDNHALLLPDMTMDNFSYDRDWGMLYSKDTAWGNVSASATNGSGYRLYNEKGNYMVAGHVAYGVLNEDNYTVGATIQKGDNLVAMGYHFHKVKPSPADDYAPKLHPEMLGGIDGQFRYNNLESAIDIYGGKFLYTDACSVLWRNGINLLPEDRLKLEAQGIWRVFEGKHYVDYSLGAAFKLTPDLTFRAMFDSQDRTATPEYHKWIGQIYYYRQLF
jgi:hypothetical protein